MPDRPLDRTRSKPGGRRRADSEGEASPAGGGWQVIFSGFVLIMLCFFIMLSSFATTEKAKVLQFVESFSSSVSVLPGGGKVSRGDRVLPPSNDVVDEGSELAAIQEEMREWILSNDFAEGLEMVLSDEGLMVRFPDSLAFEVGSADLTPKARAILREIGNKIPQNGFLVVIEGHTDDVPIHTTRFPSNWELSTGRAINVLRYFVEESGIAAERLTAMGFGEFRPLVPNRSPAERARNRRVDILLRKSGLEQNDERDGKENHGHTANG